MYQEVFDFNGRPFTMAPFVKNFFNNGPVKQALDQVNASLDRDAGPSVIVGQHGTGKSLLLALLAEQHQQRFKVISLTCGPMSERRDLLQAILFELKQQYRDMSEGELRLSLIDFIKPTENCPNGVLLLVDDAQSLTPDLVDELRLITNFVRDGIPRVRLVLCGTDRLEEVLAEPKLEPFNQRVSARCYLANLTREQTMAYVHQHIARVGGNAAMMFEKATADAIYDTTNGCPRFVNQLCEQCMIYAATHGSLVVEPDMVENAWAQVQGLPTSDADSQQPESGDENWTVIEFGSLDDDAESAFEADDPSSREQLELESAPQSDLSNDIEHTESQTVAESQIADEEQNVTELVGSTTLSSENDSESWNQVENTDPHVADQPEANTTLVNETQTEEWTSTDQAYTYQPIGPDVIASDESTDEPLSIPTEIQELNQDQDEIWAAAETPAIASIVSPTLHANDPFAIEAIVSETTDAIETASDGYQTAEASIDKETAEIVDIEQQMDSHTMGESASDVLATPVVNPFAEAFETDEVVTNEFTQLVAQQNTSSMQISGEELDHLPPTDLESGTSVEVTNQHSTSIAPPENDLEMLESAEERDLAATEVFTPSVRTYSDDANIPEASSLLSETLEPSEHVTAEAPEVDSASQPQIANHEQAIENSIQEPWSQFESSGVPVPGADLGTQTSAEFNRDFDTMPSQSAPDFNHESEITASTELEYSSDEQGASQSTESSTPDQFHEHNPYQPTADIQQQADKILSAIEVSEKDTTSNVPHETDTDLTTAPADSIESDGPYDAELSDAQRILSEILEQKNLVNEHVTGVGATERPATPEPEFPQSVPISQSLPEEESSSPQPGHADDSDMIVISELASQKLAEQANVESSSESGPVSIGRAERMDYESLFEQLRDVGKQS